MLTIIGSFANLTTGPAKSFDLFSNKLLVDSDRILRSGVNRLYSPHI